MPLEVDPLLPPAPGLAPWEPWPASIAAERFLSRLQDLLRAADDVASGLHAGTKPQAEESAPMPDATPAFSDPAPTFVLVKSGDHQQTIEGLVVHGARFEDDAWDFDGVFTVRTDDGDVRVNGWCCLVEIFEAAPD